MFDFLSCLVGCLAGLLLEVGGPLAADIDVEKPTCSTTSPEHCPDPIENNYKNYSRTRFHPYPTLDPKAHRRPRSYKVQFLSTRSSVGRPSVCECVVVNRKGSFQGRL